MRALLALLFLLPTLAGCLGEAPSEIQLKPYAGVATAAPGRTASFALHVVNTAAFRADAEVRFEGVPAGWTATAEAATLVLEGGRARSLLVNATPALDARYGLHRFAAIVGDGRADLLVHVADGDATEARPGVGAHVRTVGFWENGTIFYTNWREVRDSGVPSRSLGDPSAEPSFDPLKVYVGGRRGERPPEPYNRSGYFPVIQGFDHALRGMRAGETHATRIPPELAYTQPRNEEHPLYGEELTFVIHVISVDVLTPEGNRTIGPVACPPVVC